MAWYDFMKIFTYAFTQDPLEKKIDKRALDGAGVIQPDAIPDIRRTFSTPRMAWSSEAMSS